MRLGGSLQTPKWMPYLYISTSFGPNSFVEILQLRLHLFGQAIIHSI